MINILTFLLIFSLHRVSLSKGWDESDGQKIDFEVNKHGLSSNPYLLQARQADFEPEKQPPCNEDQLMMYLAEIQAINPEDIINLSTFEDLDNLCKKVSDSLGKMDDYLKTCEPPQQKDLYIQLIKGVNSLYEKLCTAGKFRKDFEHHYKCYHELHDDLQDCTGPADWTENEDNEKVCQAYHDIADCYYTKTAKLCGREAANLMKKLILAVINSVLIINCEGVKKNPPVAEPMPEAPNNEDDENESNKVLSNTLLIQLYSIYNLYYS